MSMQSIISGQLEVSQSDVRVGLLAICDEALLPLDC